MRFYIHKLNSQGSNRVFYEERREETKFD